MVPGGRGKREGEVGGYRWEGRSRGFFCIQVFSFKGKREERFFGILVFYCTQSCLLGDWVPL